jgi:hypothetical protein
MDMYTVNDGSLMMLDEVGNAMGGIRNPYVDAPIAKITAVNTGTAAPGAARGPGMQAGQLCGLSAWLTPLSADAL